MSAARFAIKMGDRDRAREEVETALSIDPDFLAARLMRDQLDAPATSTVLAPSPSPAPPAASLAASSAKLAQLEERVKQRVRDREALPPPRPAPPPPAIARPAASRAYRLGAVAAAGVAFLIAMSGSKIQEPRTLPARATASAAPLIESMSPEPIDMTLAAGEEEATLPERPFMRPSAPSAVQISTPAQAKPLLMLSPPPVQALPAAPPAVTDSPPPAFVPRAVDERALVEETLSRYRRAYNRLDARLAQVVYPAVNAPALARAFDGLQSQSLQFDECDIDVRGASANVTCRGTSRYVTKIGSRDPRVEPRVWDFTLSKDGGDWKIENARAGR